MVIGFCTGYNNINRPFKPDKTVLSTKSNQPSAPEMENSYSLEFNTEEYSYIKENEFLDVLKHPLSTLSIDVDTASYSNIRRFLNQGKIPPKDAVRIEEMINYFNYQYPQTQEIFSTYMEIVKAPEIFFEKDKKEKWLFMLSIKAKDLKVEELPPKNLVFLIDTSGSMNDENKLPLLKRAFSILTKYLTEKDQVSIVVYAGSAGLVLPPTSGNQKEKILMALERLSAGSSTNGGEGIELAYKVAEEHFISNGVNRVILATDGDFNVGISSEGELVRLIEEKRKSGIYLTVLGFGMGNYKDSRMEKLADKGNGNYAYIDNFREARKVLVEQLNSTLISIANDVKIQIEFNPYFIKQYRLIGYENRILNDKDFDVDTKDAGEI